MKRFSIVAILAALLSVGAAQAQTNPNLITGQVLTAAQWNALFASKQDVLGYTPLSTAGGVMTGRLVTAASSLTQAGLNIIPGIAPGTPIDGDLWATTSGLFAQVNGSSYNIVFPALSQFPSIAANTVLGSIAGGLPAALTKTQTTTLINTFTTTLPGSVPAPATVSGRFLGDDGAWHPSSGSGTVTSAAYTNSTGMAITGTTPCTVTCSWTFAIDKATAANYEAGTASKVLTSDNVFTAEVAMTFAVSQAFDFSTFLNASVTLTANITTLTCSNMKAGQDGKIRLIQDATGSRTMVSTWCTTFVWVGGVKGILSTSPNAVDYLFYSCISTTVCFASLNKAVS